MKKKKQINELGIPTVDERDISTYDFQIGKLLRSANSFFAYIFPSAETRAKKAKEKYLVLKKKMEAIEEEKKYLAKIVELKK